MSMRKIDTVGIFSGSNFGKSDCYSDVASRLGKHLTSAGISIVYGGTNKGLMGVLADSVFEEKGDVCGIITQKLYDKGHLHQRLTNFEIVSSMRQRKAKMIELADAFIALPGGIGTLEEFLEVWTLNQLGEIDKPIALLNVNGYFADFIKFRDKMIEEHFLPKSHKDAVLVSENVENLINKLKKFQAVAEPKWL